MTYYENTNPDLLKRVPQGQGAVLEIGCGAGAFARSYLARSPGTRYFGVELFEEAAARSREIVDTLIVGNIEEPATLARLDKEAGGTRFDSIVFGDVLEHLLDPWTLLAQLRERASPGAVCSICIPNVSHWSLLLQQMRGRWDYADAGLLDRTHLRFFTRATAVEMLQGAGWTVVDAFPRSFQPEKTAAALDVFAEAARKLGISGDELRTELAPLQWVIRAVNGPAPAPITIAALGMKKVGGVTEARIDHPMEAVSSRVSVRGTWGSGTVDVPRGWAPGVLILHRQFMDQPEFVAAIEKRIANGWLIVSEIDDDPHHWPQFEAARFRAFRGVHAVSVSTEPLAQLIRQWNPNVEILPNAISYLPDTPAATPKQGDRLRLFFGALNREADWGAVKGPLMQALADCESRLEVVVVHDRGFFDALPDGVAKTFHQTLPFADYMRLLASCDVALLPLADTPFNRLKSDLKFIECCAAGVVPLCSPLLYGDVPTHHEIGVFAEEPEAWGEALRTLINDPSEIARRRRLARDYVVRDRMHSGQAARREAVFRDLMSRRADLEAQRQLRLSQD